MIIRVARVRGGIGLQGDVLLGRFGRQGFDFGVQGFALDVLRIMVVYHEDADSGIQETPAGIRSGALTALGILGPCTSGSQERIGWQGITGAAALGSHTQ